jgi:heat shock protein HslJ
MNLRRALSDSIAFMSRPKSARAPGANFSAANREANTIAEPQNLMNIGAYRLFGFSLGMAVLVTGCATVRAPQLKPSTASREANATAALTLAQLRNATYRGIYNTPVTLTDGTYQGPPFQPGGASRPQVTLSRNHVWRGDIDGDGAAEAVVLLGENSGASGTRNYLAVVAERDGKPVNVATQLLGDRVQLRSLRIENSRIIADMVVHGPADAMCCPTLKLRRTFIRAGAQLSEVQRQEMGTISMADLAGVIWKLEEIARGEPVASEPAITLRFEGGRIIGFAGCNDYFAAISSEGPGRLKLSPPGATRKACPPSIMDMEAHYLKALASVTSYSFVGGSLALTYRHEGSLDTLFLAPSMQ